MKQGDSVKCLSNGKVGVISKCGPGPRGKDQMLVTFVGHPSRTAWINYDRLELVETSEQRKNRLDKELVESLAESVRYQKTKFQIELRPACGSSELISISVTHNGTQWSSISVYPEELAKVQEAIGRYLAGQLEVKP